MKEENGLYQQIGTDEAELRAFTADELEIFLTLTGFKILQVLARYYKCWIEEFMHSIQR